MMSVLCLADLEKCVEPQPARVLGQGFTIYKICSHIVERPFVLIEMFMVEGLGYDEVERCVAEWCVGLASAATRRRRSPPLQA